jgi:hypothetical protein
MAKYGGLELKMEALCGIIEAPFSDEKEIRKRRGL